MYISETTLEKDILIIKAKVDNEEEKDLFLFAENDGVPIIIELSNYINVIENELLLRIPVSIFEAIESLGKITFTLCKNSDVKTEMVLATDLIGTTNKTEYKDIYSVTVSIVSKALRIIVDKIAQFFNAKSFSLENCFLNVEVNNKDFFHNNEVSLFLKRRLTEQLWQYSDKEIYIGKFGKDGILTTSLPFTLLESDIKKQYYDFILKTEINNVKTEYFLYFSDGFEAGKVICSNSCEEDTEYKKLEVYYSAGKNLSARYLVEKRYSGKVKELLLQDNMIKIVLSQIDYNGCLRGERLVIKKRTYNNEKLYCFTWKKELLKVDDEYVFEENVDKILESGVKSNDEYWDVYIEIGTELFPVLCDRTMKTKYFEISGGCKICFFGNSEGKLSVYTHEGDYKLRNKVNIAVLGTCFSRSAFKSDPYFNPDYKRFYDCVYTQFHSSIISLTSSKMERWEKVDNWGKEAMLYMPTEFDKDFFEKLKESKAQYLFLDNYIDATRPLIDVGNGTYLTYSKYWTKSNMLRKFANCKFIKPGTEEYYELYKKHARIFIEKVKECMPESHIILLQGRFSYSKIDEKTNKIEEWSGKPYIQRNNMRWDNVDSILLSIAPKIRVVNMRETKYLSDLDTPIPGGASPSHYQRYYYREILDKINKVILEDMIIEKLQSREC